MCANHIPSSYSHIPVLSHVIFIFCHLTPTHHETRRRSTSRQTQLRVNYDANKDEDGSYANTSQNSAALGIPTQHDRATRSTITHDNVPERVPEKFLRHQWISDVGSLCVDDVLGVIAVVPEKRGQSVAIVTIVVLHAVLEI